MDPLTALGLPTMDFMRANPPPPPGWGWVGMPVALPFPSMQRISVDDLLRPPFPFPPTPVTLIRQGEPAPVLTLNRYANRQVKTIFYGDSHLRSKHHVTGFFLEELTKNNRYCPKIESWADAKFKSKALLTMSDDVVKFICEQITKEGKLDSPAFHVISLGSNNVRERRRAFGPESVDLTIEYLKEGYRKILRHSQTVPKSKVFVVAPFLSQNVADRPFLERLHQELKHLVPREGGEYVSIISEMTEKVEEAEGNLPIRFERKDFFDDKVHLSKVGAKLLAQKLIKAFNLVPNKILGLRSVNPARVKKLSKFNEAKRATLQ